MKIIIIVGARPQFIKASVVCRELSNHKEINEIIVHTGQHFDDNMSEIFFQEMQIKKPKYNLNVNGLGHASMTGQMLIKIEEVLLKEHPDLVMVFGDTNSTLAGALAAKKLHIKLAHTEAGLRSFNMKMPEEINRILTDRISDILFCPTKQSVDNLYNEGFEKFDCSIFNVGDVMFDAALYYSDKAKRPNFEIPSNFILATIHRAENTDSSENLASIMKALEDISNDIHIILPIHPRTKSKLKEINFNFNKSKIIIVEPVGYLEMVYLIKNSEFVMTDSGGLQKEAYFFKKMCITLRDETEWVELIEGGYNNLSGSDHTRIINHYNNIKGRKSFDNENGYYGNGDASKKILQILLKQ